MRYSEHICIRYQQAVEFLAKRWTTLILKVLIEEGEPMRFSELKDRINVVSDRVLSERLKELEQEGVVDRKVYPEIPVRVEYSLTDKGRSLTPIVKAIEDWSHEWVALEPEVAKAE
jgi:DNA-binding HxlR family transcriptional regulator